MKTDLTPEQVARGREFLKDLRANDKKAKVHMRDKDGGRCCLCVAYDTAQRLGAGLYPLGMSAGMPPHEMADFYGWPYFNPLLSGQNADAWNDGRGVPEKTHAEIADLFEQEFPQLKEDA